MIRSEQSFPSLAEKQGETWGQFFAVGNRMTAIGSSPDNEIRILWQTANNLDQLMKFKG